MFDASVKIQSRVRGYKARKTTSTLKNKRAQHIASSKIQSNWRRRKASVDYSEKRKAAVKLQSMGRGWSERRQFALQNYAAIRIQAEWRKYITRETYLYVLHYRGTKATAIQATWRGYFSRKAILTTINLFLLRKHQYDKVRNSPPPKHTGY